MATIKFIKGDIIKNKITKRLSLVTKVEGNTFVLADPICPQFGYKAHITISPLYEFVKHINNSEFNNRMNREI